MKAFGLAAIVLILAGSSFALAQEVPTPAPAEEPSGQPGAIRPPLTPAEKTMRPVRGDRRLGPAEPFSGGAGIMTPSPMMQGEINGHPQVPPMSDGVER
jgi:hypothetical protein